MINVILVRASKLIQLLNLILHREHEEGMDALQADIDNLEAEKTELQKKLKELSKKSLFAGLAKQLASPGFWRLFVRFATHCR